MANVSTGRFGWILSLSDSRGLFCECYPARRSAVTNATAASRARTSAPCRGDQPCLGSRGEVSQGELFSRDGLYEEIAEESENGERWVDRNPGENEKQRPWPEIERLYGELKKNYEAKGDFPRAGDFHIGEKEARRRNPNTSYQMKALLWAYRTLSRYGERALPATIWLLTIVLDVRPNFWTSWRAN